MAGAIGAAWRAVRDLIQGEISRGGPAAADLARNFADASRGAADSLSDAASEAADQVKWLTGMTFDRRPVRFRPADVWSKPLIDAHGARIGATFQPDQGGAVAQRAIRWAEQDTRQADTEVVPT